MAKSVDVASWVRATPKEVVAFYKSRPGPRKPNRSGFLIVRAHLKPVDVYAYLRVRFGTPNGFQNVLRKDDSDNWIHWDYSLKADDVDIYIAGTSRDIHFIVSERMRDVDWKDLILALKADFGRNGRAKSEMMQSFERYVVFQNKFVTLADLCAEMHEVIVDMPPAHTLPIVTTKQSLRRYRSEVKRLGKRAADLYGNCLKLRLLTPIMAEAFVNMVILMFCKDEVRNDRAAYEAFIRSAIPERIAALSENCHGFRNAIDQTTPVYRDFKRVMDKRNFAIHGNMDPVREQIETVYFEGRRPLFAEGGDNILKFFDHLERMNAPEIVVADYEAVHLFLAEIAGQLSDQHRAFFDQVIGDPYPGYDLNRKRTTRILPDHYVRGLMPRMRYDDELKVTW
ncbi:hypothetical protein [Taklimakanibacter lacteus]|uniref:hypothetical protein n=1 Tax=Taklimakanibacter lacteus TaxID=2268456 RepID=UPI000E67296A